MESKQLPVVRRRLTLDGALYELSAIEVGYGGYQASWLCPECNVGGASALTYPRPEAAIEWARGCVSIHASEVHARTEVRNA